MPSRSRLAAAAFNDGQSNYRVFYQDSGFLLKESCFEDSHGWYIRENCIVANDAKKYTSLAAVSWADGNEIRVYYMNNKNKILERKWSVDGSEDFGVWQPGSAVVCSTPDPQTQLAAVSTEEPDGSIRIRLFYQSTNRELRQTSYNSEKRQWEDAVLESENSGKLKALRGSSLAVSSGSATHLFFLAGPRDIVVLREDNGKWKSKHLAKMPVAEKTPIAVAPPLDVELTKSENYLLIFFKDRRGKLLQKSFDMGKEDIAEEKPKKKEEGEEEEEDSDSDWDGEMIEDGGAITIASSSEDDASVFYQSSATTISEYSVKDRFELNLGIPTSQGGDLRAYLRMTGAGRSSPDTGMLGLVESRRVDILDSAQRERLIQRVTEAMSKAVTGDAFNNTSIFYPIVEKLSVDFDLGITWQSEGSQWRGLDTSTGPSVWRDGSYPLRRRIEGAQAWIFLAYIGKSDYTRKFFYLDTLNQIARYLGIGKEPNK